MDEFPVSVLCRADQSICTIDHPVRPRWMADGETFSSRHAAVRRYKPKQRMLGPAATTTYCWPPVLKVMGEAFMRTFVGNCHMVLPSR